MRGAGLAALGVIAVTGLTTQARAVPLDYAKYGVAPKSTDIADPDWLRPGKLDLGGPLDPRLDKGGLVVLRCSVRSNGSMSDCRILKEEPEHLGLGPWALKIGAQFRIRPSLPDGQPVAGRTVVIPIKYRAP